ncbi:BnaC04g53750D [Brassica napus]|uniref:BnaC04g53750D protein n=1 Tax=Brassica napus TaxID=3708 RepID=A0A078IQW1_BRANA|nr:BnaC04g53750D [Brassica napus]
MAASGSDRDTGNEAIHPSGIEIQQRRLDLSSESRACILHGHRLRRRCAGVVQDSKGSAFL